MVRSTSLSWAHGADAVNFTYGVVSLVMGCVMLVCLGVAARRRGSSVNAYGGGASLQLILPIYFNIVGAFTLEYLVQGIVEIAADMCVERATCARTRACVCVRVSMWACARVHVGVRACVCVCLCVCVCAYMRVLALECVLDIAIEHSARPSQRG
jgi:hypothetical protein